MVKQMMHVDWPPMVDSGGSGRPVLNCASASDVTAVGGGEGGMSSAAGAAEATSRAASTWEEPSGTCCKLAGPGAAWWATEPATTPPRLPRPRPARP